MPDQPDGAPAPSPYTVAVVGLGGTGLTLVRRLAGAGLTVVGIDDDPAALVRAQELSPSERPRTVTRFPAGVTAADLVIEAVPEPAALFTFMLGLGLAGATLRRRAKQVG